jgi:hypothetical protein
MNLERGDFALVYFPHSDLRMVKLRPQSLSFKRRTSTRASLRLS